MSTYTDSVGDVDIIFVGGGTAACVAAGRLAKANPDLKILLIEGGKNNFNDPTVVNPAVYLSHLAPDSKSAIVGILFYFRLWLLIVSSSSTNQEPQNISEVVRPLSLWGVCSVVVPLSIS
jgi:choline dehydrogenase-like flavoprotein